MNTPLLLLAAMVLDAVMGEPKWLWDRVPHPAVLMGRVIAWFDRKLNQKRRKKTKGIFVVLILVFGALLLGLALAKLGWVAQVVITAILLAQRSLSDHVLAVAQGLDTSVSDGRLMVARIVSRDTGAMSGPAVARSAIESAAENLSDGVIAPAFWFLIGGLPGLLIYKIVNTADSMIGYRTPQYKDFGWAAARLDDLMNLIPARLTCLLIALAYGALGQWRAIAADARRHKSPNAGWPEAAMARALDVALAGPRSYDGVITDFPFVHPSGTHTPGAATIRAANAALWRAWILTFVCVGLIVII